MKEETRERILDELKAVGGLNPKSGMTYALQHFSEVARLGIGVSRREITRGTGKLSPFIHNWNTFHRYMGICRELVLCCRKEGINKLHKLHYDAVERFILRKIEMGRSHNTIETNVCALQKFLHVSGRCDLRDQLNNDYARFKELARPGGTIHAFDNPDRLIEKISERDELSGVIARLQRRTGARIHEIRPLEVTEEAIVIRKGKGGKRRVLDFSCRLDELAEVKNLMARLKELSKGVNWQAYCQGEDSTYQSHVKAACRSRGDEYVGAHGFRGNYSQEHEKKLEKRGLPPEERELIITHDLGHNRRSMARHYLHA